MADRARELLDAYAASYTGCDGECTHNCNDDRACLAPQAFGALRAVLEEHAPEDADPDFEPGKTFSCTGCMDAYGEYRPYPCATVRAITTALEAS